MTAKLPFEKKHLMIALIIMIVTGIICIAYLVSGSQIRVLSPGTEQEVELAILADGKPIEINIEIPQDADQIYGFKLWITAHDRVDFGTYTVTLLENGQEIYSQTSKTQFLRSGRDTIFKLDHPVKINRDSQYTISISEQYAEGDDGISVWQYLRLITLPSSSGLARLVIAGTLFVSVLLIVVMGLVCLSGTKHFGAREFFMLDVCAVVLLFMGAVFFQYPDGPTITSWGKYVLDTIKTGQFRDFMRYAYNTGIDSGLDQRVYQFSKPNYNILVNLLTAVMLLPAWIVDNIFKCGWSMELYDDFRKLYLIASIVLTARYIRKTTTVLGFEEHVGYSAGFLYMLSPVLIWGNIGLGQIDPIVVLFIMIAVYYLAQGKYEWTFFWLSASVTVKQFALFFVVAPLLCLIIGTLDIRRILKCIGMYLILPVVSAVASRLLIPDYSGMASIYEDEWNHIARFFDFTMAYTSYFLMAFMLICFLCLCKGLKKDVRPIDYLLGPVAICISFQVFSELNQQWTIYVLIALVIASLYMERRYEFVIIMIVMALGYYLYVSGTPHNGDDSMVTTGALGHIFKLYNNTYVFQDVFNRVVPGYSTYIHSVGATMLSASAIAGAICLGKGVRPDVEIDKEVYADDRWVAGGGMIIAAISLGAILMSILLYFGIIIP